MELVLKEECYEIMGACFEVYRELGAGFLEAVYQEALVCEFQDRRIPARSQPDLLLRYKGRELRRRCIPDFICFDKVILEIKACQALDDNHRAQVHNYLKATGCPLGILVNFGQVPKVQWERIVRTHGKECLPRLQGPD